MSGRLGAWGLTGALAYSFAVIIHGVIHAVGVDHAVILSTPHAIMALSAIVLLALSVRALGAGTTNAERRRRLALVRTHFARASTSVTVAIAAGEVLLAGGLFLTEGVAPDLDRLGIAILSGAIALGLTALALRVARRRVIAVVAFFVAAVCDEGGCSIQQASTCRPLLNVRTVFHRRLQFRGPPQLLASV